MQRRSETIGAIAGALAKAQAGLTNPAKSLTATIPALFPRETDRTFRYTPLSAGLEIVRKCLGQHEIAVVQNTAIEKEAGFIQLTTLLAHSSGEWMSSDWPVCPVSETAAPHRMGAALTYARRYSLFALVGIAGEDDLDAPDLPTLELKGDVGIAPRSAASGRSGNGHASAADTTAITTSRPLQRSSIPRAKPILDADASATRREELLTEIAALASSDQIDGWAVRAIEAKNALNAADAHRIEEAFRDKLAALAPPPEASVPAVTELLGFEHYAVTPKPRRLRDKRHRQFVSAQPCVVCGRQPSDAHHLRFTQPKALGLKVSDEFTVPLCRMHHREVHRTVKELEWWERLGIDPIVIADTLWLETHPRTVSGPAPHLTVQIPETGPIQRPARNEPNC